MPIYRAAPRTKQDLSRLCELAHMADEKDSTDVLGMYTGMGADGEEPVQDADDL